MKSTVKKIALVITAALCMAAPQQLFAYSDETIEIEDILLEDLLSTFFFHSFNSIRTPYMERYLSDSSATCVTINTNNYSASIYVDGKYIGSGNKTIYGLSAGRHSVKILCSNYETEEFNIKVSSGKECLYYINLQTSSGTLKLDVSPSNAEITVDGQSYYSFGNTASMDLEPGRHFITVSAFGYESWSSYIDVYRRKTTNISLQLDPVAFELKKLQLDKAKFNPQNNSLFGSLGISMTATAPAEGTVRIYNSFDQEIWASNVSFNSWTTKLYWSGVQNDGTFAPDGKYRVTVSAAGYTKSSYVTVNNSIFYSHLLPTASGTGKGIVASAEIYQEPTVAFDFKGGFNRRGSFLYSESMMLNPGPYFEAVFGVNGKITQKQSSTPKPYWYSQNDSTGYGCFKTGFSIDADLCSLYMAMNFRAGELDNDSQPDLDFITDTGCGLGTGLMMGVKTGKLYTGVESTIIFHPVYLATYGDDFMWKNGVLLQYTGKNAAFSAYGALNSCFGTYEDEKGNTRDMDGWFTSLQAGTELSFFPGSSFFAFNIGTQVTILPDYSWDQSVYLGASFTF